MLGRLGLATRLFGQDPKLEFRKPGQGASLLAGPAIPASDPYWTTYFTLFDSFPEVHTLLDASTLLLTSQQSPSNLSTLISVCCDHLFTLLSGGEFGRREEGRREALNCLRVLSRTVPFLLRRQSAEPGVGEEELFWRREKVRVERAEAVAPPTAAGQEEEGQFVIDDDEEEDGEEATTPKADAPQGEREEREELPPLAERLLAALVDLAFVPGFTVPEECRGPDGAVSYIIWEPGIAHAPSPPPPTTSSTLLSARLEVLRLLSILLALPSLLTPPHAFPSLPNRWREVLVGRDGGGLGKRVVLCFLCSLVNTVLGLGGSVGGGGGEKGAGGGSEWQALATGAADKLSGVVLRREDVRGLLGSACAQVLGALLVEHAPPPPPSATTGEVGTTTTTTPGPSPFIEQPATMGSTSSATAAAPSNAFAFYLSKLHRAADFEFLLVGFLGLLERGVGGGGGGGGGTVQQTLVFLWRVIDANPKFGTWLNEQERVGEVLAWLVVVGLEGKDDETQVGLVRLSAFLLQSLTADRSAAFAARLNAPVELRPALRSKYGVPGSLADFIIISLCTLIFTTQGRLSALYPSFVLTIDNISPHLKHLSAVASTRLTKLFLAFSAPGFLLMEEGNPRLVYYLLETFNNVIHLQLSDNPELIYALIRAHERFDQLATFTLSGGVAEVRRARLEKKARAGLGTIAETPARGEEEAREEGGDEGEGAEGEGEKEVSEKVRGKRRDLGAGGERERRRESISSLSVADLSLAAGAGGGAEEGQPFVGKNGFVPTEGWVASWRGGLPLDSIHIMLSELRPLVLDLPSTPSAPLSSNSTSPTSAISLLSSASLSGLLPPTSPPTARKHLPSPQSMTWLASLVYGDIYLANLELLREVQVQLFGVAQGGGRRGFGGLLPGGGNPLEFVSGAARELLQRVGR